MWDDANQVGESCYNRTYVELKQSQDYNLDLCDYSYNRTYVELKHVLSGLVSC